MVTTRSRAYDNAGTESKRRKVDKRSATIVVSRACGICLTEDPRSRSFFSPCGHICCCACSLKLRLEAFEERVALQCSFCRSAGEYGRLSEELIENNPSTSNGVEQGATEEAVEDAALKDAEIARSEYIDALTRLSDAVGNSTDAIRYRLAASRVRLDFLREGRREMPIEVARAFLVVAKEGEEAADRAVDEAERVEEGAKELKDAACRKFEDGKAQINQLIGQFKRENDESSALRFSRVCRACDTEAPRLRSLFTACGHAVCRDCADKSQAGDAGKNCPICDKIGKAINIFENVIESD